MNQQSTEYLLKVQLPLFNQWLDKLEAEIAYVQAKLDGLKDRIELPEHIADYAYAASNLATLEEKAIGVRIHRLDIEQRLQLVTTNPSEHFKPEPKLEKEQN